MFWEWKNKINWIYNNAQTYASIFAVSRIKSSAIDFLFKRRLDHAKIFEKSNKISKRWLICEIFVPTELMNNMFLCERIDEPYMRAVPVYNIDECIKINHLYHPVKSN